MEEELPCKREDSNDKDCYAVAIFKPIVGIVGHIPHYISRPSSVFIRKSSEIDSEIYSIVTETRQYC